MSDLFDLGGSDGVAINTSNVEQSGDFIFQYASKLSEVLQSFDSEVTILRNNGMSGEHSVSLGNAYDSVKDSLSEYAVRLGKVGLAVSSSAEDLAKRSTESADNISVN